MSYWYVVVLLGLDNCRVWVLDAAAGIGRTTQVTEGGGSSQRGMKSAKGPNSLVRDAETIDE